MKFSSKIVEDAVNVFSTLPGIGKRTALRFVLQLIKSDKENLQNFSNTLLKLKNDLKYCNICKIISETEICDICMDNTRNANIICVVENLPDVIAIENTQEYNGMYHVLSGLISPIDGISVKDIYLQELLYRVENDEIDEIIFALSTTIEGDTTSQYIYNMIKSKVKKISILSRGIALGDEMNLTDEITLANSLKNRMLFEKVDSF